MTMSRIRSFVVARTRPEVPGPGGGRGRVDEAVIPGHDTAAGAAGDPPLKVIGYQ